MHSVALFNFNERDISYREVVLILLVLTVKSVNFSGPH